MERLINNGSFSSQEVVIGTSRLFALFNHSTRSQVINNFLVLRVQNKEAGSTARPHCAARRIPVLMPLSCCLSVFGSLQWVRQL